MPDRIEGAEKNWRELINHFAGFPYESNRQVRHWVLAWRLRLISSQFAPRLLFSQLSNCSSPTPKSRAHNQPRPRNSFHRHRPRNQVPVAYGKKGNTAEV